MKRNENDEEWSSNWLFVSVCWREDPINAAANNRERFETGRLCFSFVFLEIDGARSRWRAPSMRDKRWQAVYRLFNWYTGWNWLDSLRSIRAVYTSEAVGGEAATPGWTRRVRMERQLVESFYPREFGRATFSRSGSCPGQARVQPRVRLLSSRSFRGITRICRTFSASPSSSHAVSSLFVCSSRFSSIYDLLDGFLLDSFSR